jgi:hypothetical protein
MLNSQGSITLLQAASKDFPYPREPKFNAMKIDTDAIDEAILALLQLTLHDNNRAWKGFDWDALHRLYERGLIHDPVTKAKSIVLTDEGMRESERLFKQLFTVPAERRK